MTITTCDVCKFTLSEKDTDRSALKGTAALMSESDVRVGGVECREFDFAIDVTTMRFNTTNFHVCNKCLIAAIHASIRNQQEAV